MRNFVLFFMMFAFGLFAKAQNDVVVTWLPADETVKNSFGSGSAASTFTACMEFNSDDLLNYKSTGKSLATIKQIQFSLAANYLSSISVCNVIIRQGADFATSTEVVTQAVQKNSLVANWNIVDLDNAYTIDLSQSLYIGYQLSFSAGAYPFNVATGTDPKQGWLFTGDGVDNAAANGYVFLIKAVAGTQATPADEIKVSALNIVKYNNLNDSLIVRGTVQNVGTAPITSFSVSYELNGVQSSVYTFTGVDIAPNGSYNFTHPKKCFIDSIASNQITVRAFDPNGETDKEYNNTMASDVRVYSSAVQRVVLHEVFTSATCGPCKQGNEQLKRVLDAVDFTKWACIKYQYYFPGYGDSYFTMEGYTRGAFYNGISGVPTLFGDGSAYSPNSYTVPKFNALEAIPAIATMAGTVTITNKTVGFQGTITPVTNMDNPNLRFFAAIVEKKTVNNEATNDEHEFNYVMRKFMTDIKGDVIDPLRNNQAIQLNSYSYTFNGNYRLPEDSYDMIDHTTEHSVEDFNNLMVIYWLQDIVTKEVFQAGKTDPNPGYTPVAYTVTVVPSSSSMGMVAGGHKYAANTMARIYAEPIANYRFVRWSNGATNPVYTFTVTQDTSFTAIFESTTDVTDIDDISSSITIHPNPVQDMLYITTEANIKQVEIYNLQGQLIRTENASLNEISTTNLSSGLYMLRITSEQGGVSVHKFIKQ